MDAAPAFVEEAAVLGGSPLRSRGAARWQLDEQPHRGSRRTLRAVRRTGPSTSGNGADQERVRYLVVLGRVVEDQCWLVDPSGPLPCACEGSKELSPPLLLRLIELSLPYFVIFGSLLCRAEVRALHVRSPTKTRTDDVA